jgi:Platelet-activating factor acetylhydrolase, isoform II
MLAHLAAALAVAATLAAQAPYAVGTRDVAWPNTTGQGAASLTARVLYPATAAGTNVPLLPQPGGWPVVVFLHGFATSGTSYVPIGTQWAQQGFVVVLSNTSVFDNVGQENDGRALYPALVAANAAVGGPFQNGLDVQRTALAGHSMGGGNVANVMRINPGYRCGYAIAPVAPRDNNGALVTVPLGIVAGQGDVIAPATTYAVPYYNSLTAYGDLKFYYLMNGEASHTNLAGLFVTTAAGTAIQNRVASIGLGLFRHSLGLSPLGLDDVVGPPALAEPRLVSLQQQFARSLAWTSAALRPGTTVRASAGMEPGLGGLAAAAGALTAPLPTPFGELRLEPASAYVFAGGVVDTSRRLDATIVVPNDPALVGAVVSLQAFGPARGAALLLGGAVAAVVEN